jgi:hypothetical protein
MRQNAGLLTQHVSSIIMPIFRGTLVSPYTKEIPVDEIDIQILLIMLIFYLSYSTSSVYSHIVTPHGIASDQALFYIWTFLSTL